MSKFKISWRIAPAIYLDENKWQGLLRLIDNCKGAVDEIAFYIIDDTHPELSPIEDIEMQARVLSERFTKLRTRGCTVGINVWPTLPLYPKEQKYFPNMQRMVGIDGKTVEGVACPCSEEFLEHMREKYIVLAKSKPDFIWVDDDCRFTHIDGFYPCFCDKCVSGFMDGKFKNREELSTALENENFRDLRIAWSSYGADRLAALCTHLRAAVDEVDESIDIGLMTVGATHTTFSGDYIEKCMRALRSKRGRPGHDLYNDTTLDKLSWKALEVGRQVLEYPDTAEYILWEEDSCPQGHLGKSLRTRQNEASLGIIAGCNGIAFNHAAYNGDLDERLLREARELCELRPRWEKALELSDGLPSRGMWPYHSWYFTAKANPEYAWLRESPFSDTENPECDTTVPQKIGVYGIPITADSDNACATLLSGKTITALDKDKLLQVFSGAVYMDGSALAELEKIGLAHLAGVKINPKNHSAKFCTLSDHSFNGIFKNYVYRKLPDVRSFTLLPISEGVEHLGYREKASESDRLLYISKYTNSLGGKVIVNAFDAWKYCDNPCNLHMLSSIAEWFGSPLYLRWENPHAVSRVQPYIRSDNKSALVMLLNASLDSTNPLKTAIKGDMTRAYLINRKGELEELPCTRCGDYLLVDTPTIEPWDIGYIFAK